MVPLALPVMIGLTAEEILAGTVLGAAAAVGVGAAVDAFRRGGAEAVATGREGLASLAEMVSDAVAGALLPVGVGPPPNWNPLGDGLAAIKGAVDSIWGQLNSKQRTTGGGETVVTLTNNTGANVVAWFTVYEVGNLPPGLNEPKGYILPTDDISLNVPWYNPWASYRSVDVQLPPGTTSASIRWFATGNPNPAGRDAFFRLTAGGQNYDLSITDYRPGQFLGYAIFGLPGSITKGSAPAGVSYPNNLAPSKITSQPTTAALPAPLPAAVGRWEDFLVITAPEPASEREPTAKAAPGQLPLPLGLPAAPAPMKATGFDTTGLPIPQAAPAVKPTSTTTHQVGPLTIPAKAPQATLQGIAEEVGRIEQKLEIVLNPGNQAPGIDWMNNLGKIAELLFSATAAGDYELTSGCELDANRQRIIKRAAYGGSIDRIGVIENKIDALAELMQHSKDLKQPACIPPTKPSTVTVTAYQLPPYT